MYIIALIIALVAGAVLLVIIKTPRLTAKKTIVETIIGVSDALFHYRQEVRSLITDSFLLYQPHDSSAFVARRGTASRRKLDIEQKLAGAESHLAAYEKTKAHKQFYDVATATVGAIRQVVGSLDELQTESATLEPIITELQRINTATMDTNMTTYISSDDNSATGRVVEHIETLTGLLNQTARQVNSLSFQTDEFQRIAQSIAAALARTEQEYAELRGFLSSGQYEAYRNKNMSLPNFLARFDMNSYESIVTAVFSHTPEESYTIELRTHLYS